MEELFDKKFVHFMWDDELEGKKGFVSNDIECLRDYVNNNPFATELIEHSSDEAQPFEITDGIRFRFFYYDPNYEVKKAFNEGKVIQFRYGSTDWQDYTNQNHCWDDEDREWRVKPKEEKWVAYLARDEEKSYLTACREDIWNHAQKGQGAKTKLFVGTKSEVTEWYESRQKFVEVIKAWEDGKTIQFLSRQQQSNGEWMDVWYDCIGLTEPKFLEKVEYRVKPEKKKYRPYKSSVEMIDDYLERFNASCPSYAEPLIWVKRKDGVERVLIIKFGEVLVALENDTYWDMKDLLEQYAYLDGSPCGMEVKE